ncbi:hypothetical protein FHW67_002403 [Herbaspirillum sp. Sphag1AN]|nr:hypothetical protein [Herbaspirillum sp. Sphag1AN]MBB3246311.1 hypothetical protein [Herbaspirillum sp. Sphag64]
MGQNRPRAHYFCRKTHLPRNALEQADKIAFSAPLIEESLHFPERTAVHPHTKPNTHASSS